MARMGVFSRNNDIPDVVPRSLQLLKHRNTFDARYMEIYPNFSEILYPNESISLKVTNFVRSLPMKRPQMSRVRVYQSFVAVPIRLLWFAWEDYIKGENDAQFLYEEPYICNSTDGGESAGTQVGHADIGFDGGFCKLVTVHHPSGSDDGPWVIDSANTPIGPSSTITGHVRRRGVLLDQNSYVNSTLNLNKPSLSQGQVGDTERKAYMKVGVHELGDYFFHPLYVSTGKYFVQGYGDIDETFSAFKFAAYQLAYSYFERSPNVQVRQDDFYEMSQPECYDFPGVIACVNSDNNPVPPDEYYFSATLNSPLNEPVIRKVKTVSQGTITAVERPRDLTLSSERADVLRSSWEFVEKFPLKSGANLSMLACAPHPQTGNPMYVPSNISLTRKRFANWQTDYFTSCNPWQQRGEEAKIPISGSTTVSIGDLTVSIEPKSATVKSVQIGVRNGTYGDVSGYLGEYHSTAVASGETVNLDQVKLSNTVGGTAIGAEYHQLGVSVQAIADSLAGNVTSSGGSSSVTGSGLYVSPSNFRFAMTLQHIKEMQAEIDNRYQSYIRKFFGARAKDYRLDRPEFIGGSVLELNVSDVTQTSQTSSDSVLGDLAGKSVSAGTSKTIRYHADEHTVILGLLHIQPDTEYIGGLSRVDSTKDRFDWALPQFSHLSEQAVKNKELSFSGITNYTNDMIQQRAFGYQPVLNHLRWRPNIACGAFRDTLNSTGNYAEYKPWISVRDFGASIASNGFLKFNTPTLSDKFLSGRYNRDNSNFDIVDDEKIYPFMVDSYFDERMVRIISSRGTPRRLG